MKKTASKSPIKKKVKRLEKRDFTVLECDRKSIRHSTALKSAETKHRLKELNEAQKLKKKTVKIEEYMPTQDELLEEALITEEENIKSLEKFKKLEMEKKKSRPTKRNFVEPLIRYNSLSVPLSSKTKTRSGIVSETAAPEFEERTYITFLNDINEKCFKKVFKNKKQRPNYQSNLCPITRYLLILIKMFFLKC